VENIKTSQKIIIQKRAFIFADNEDNLLKQSGYLT
jgi:hypothetical protein